VSAPRFTVTLQPKSGVEPIRALRRRLKMLAGTAACAQFQFRSKMTAMLSLSDQQLRSVMDAAARVAADRRDVFLQRVGAMLTLRGRFDDSDVSEVCMLASCGLCGGRAPQAQ
jgi:hypothetical protein